VSCSVEEEASCARLGRTNASVPTRAFALMLYFSSTVGQGYFYAVVVFGQTRFGELEFEVGKDFGGGFDGFGVLADLTRHLQKDAVDLGLFVVEEAD